MYADWLEERDDRRGAYLRTEVALAALSPWHEGYDAMTAALPTLRGGVDAAWIEAAGKRWDVVLHGYGPDTKIGVIRQIRAVTGYNLFRSREMAEVLPSLVRFAIPRPVAEPAVATLSEVCYAPRIDATIEPTRVGPVYGLIEYPQSPYGAISSRRQPLTREQVAAALSVVATDAMPAVFFAERQSSAFSLLGQRWQDEPLCRVVLRAFAAEQAAFVTWVVAGIRGETLSQARERIETLPAVVSEGQPVALALWDVARFRGRAEVEVLA